ncbi:hypothetical protein D6D87_02435 [Moraxella catarrhalis]|nr:hypothetical protein D6D87_02435 [Moraxella catarrhalis]
MVITDAHQAFDELGVFLLLFFMVCFNEHDDGDVLALSDCLRFYLWIPRLPPPLSLLKRCLQCHTCHQNKHIT